MSYFDILAKFLEMFPQFHEQICQYAPNGLNCITVWFRNGQVLDFTYNSLRDWTLVKHKEFDYSDLNIYKLWRY